MKIERAAHKKLQKIPQKDALHVLYTLLEYKNKRQGYIKWLEGRRGYRIKIGKYRAIFELNDDELIILTIIQDAHTKHKN